MYGYNYIARHDELIMFEFPTAEAFLAAEEFYVRSAPGASWFEYKAPPPPRLVMLIIYLQAPTADYRTPA